MMSDPAAMIYTGSLMTKYISSTISESSHIMGPRWEYGNSGKGV